MGQVETKHASAGEIVGLTGFEEVFIGETLTDREERTPLQFVDIDPPTYSDAYPCERLPVRRTRRKVRDRPPQCASGSSAKRAATSRCR
jgi:predicted membrane GTPase involved in stress response